MLLYEYKQLAEVCLHVNHFCDKIVVVEPGFTKFF